MIKQVAADVVIFGGGIAGLWLLNRLRQQGLSALLFESDALGGGQTIKSQGIIHGGMKYALQGALTSEAMAMSDMPAFWRACLQGTGEIDLSAVPVLSQQQYLWAPQRFTSKITGFLAGAALSSKVTPVKKADYPPVFQHARFKGEVFALDEMVLDVPILVRELVKANSDAVFKIEPVSENEFKFDQHHQLESVTVYMAGKALLVKAQRFIFTAGAGNEVIVNKLALPQLAMQRRPLHMVLVKTPAYEPLYAHCLGFGSKPRMTITAHRMQDGSGVWYLGGALAEEGVNKSSDEQIKAARAELLALFPWLDFSQAAFATFKVDRAEPKQKSGLKPEQSYFHASQHAIVAWPTKLALAPKLAADIMHNLEAEGVKPQYFDVRELRAWPLPPLAQPIWEEIFCKSVS